VARVNVPGQCLGLRPKRRGGGHWVDEAGWCVNCGVMFPDYAVECWDCEDSITEPGRRKIFKGQAFCPACVGTRILDGKWERENYV
jgi:hypothetical protein